MATPIAKVQGNRTPLSTTITVASAGLAVVPAPTGLWAWRGHSALRYLPNMDALEHSTAALYELLGELVRGALAALDLRRQAP